MRDYVVHIIAKQPTIVSNIAAMAKDLQPTAGINEYETLSTYLDAGGQRPFDAREIMVTEFEPREVPLNKRNFYVPIIRFSTVRMDCNTASDTNRLLGESPPVFIGDIKPHLREAFVTADYFFRLKSNVSRLATLTERERRVVNFAAEGMPNKAIARRLGVSIKTVENNRRNAYTKLSVKSSAEVASLVTFGRFFAINL